ncbi:MAG TPA: hypothetical protein VHX62_16960 [Solirubrobacteraceae bacterium]|nr:hypothetical protein [Solirubrobacteraceae bacterium]
MNLRPRDRVAIGVIAVLAVCAGFYVLLLKPEQGKASSLAASVAQEKQTLVSEQQAYTTGKAAAASLKTDAAEWGSLRLAVPEQSDIPALLRLLQSSAGAAHVQMSAITLSSPTAATATSSTPAGAAPAAGATGVPISLTFSGGYNALNALVQHLDGLVTVAGDNVVASGPLLSISSVQLSPSHPSLTVQMNATIYQLAGASPAAGSTGG